MAVNHYIMTDAELINRLVELTQDCTTVNDKKYEGLYEWPDYMEYDVKRSKEFWDIRKELFERLKK